MLNVCTAVSQFPIEGTCVLAADDSRHRTLAALLRVFRPRLTLAGIADQSTAAGAALVVVTGAPWRPHLDRLARLGVPAERVVLFVPPVGDYCGYLDFFTPLLDEARADGTGVTIGWEALHRRLRDNKAAAIGRLGRMLLEPDRCFSANPPPPADRPAVERVMASMSPEQAAAYQEMMRLGSMEWVRRFTRRLFNHVQYFDHIRLTEGDVVVNCGLATGWEMPMVLSRLGATGTVWCIDPTGETYVEPEPRAVIDEHRDQVRTVPTALMDFTGRIGGVVKGDMAFLGAAGAPGSFPCTTLDQLVQDKGIDRIDLIKMDIEGSELPALKGMAETIRRLRPQLAISVYHKPDDLWRLPDYILGLVPDYVTFVESYCYNRSETIAYMIPPERLAGAPSWGLPGVAPTPVRLEVTGRWAAQAAWVVKWLAGRRG